VFCANVNKEQYCEDILFYISNIISIQNIKVNFSSLSFSSSSIAVAVAAVIQLVLHPMWLNLLHESVSKSFRTESITKYTLTTINTRWEATQRVMAVKLTRLTHKIAIQLHLVAESCTIRSSRAKWPVRKLLDTPSYTIKNYLTKFPNEFTQLDSKHLNIDYHIRITVLHIMLVTRGVWIAEATSGSAHASVWTYKEALHAAPNIFHLPTLGIQSELIRMVSKLNSGIPAMEFVAH
jgi:hypothetical protein